MWPSRLACLLSALATSAAPEFPSSPRCSLVPAEACEEGSLPYRTVATAADGPGEHRQVHACSNHLVAQLERGDGLLDGLVESELAATPTCCGAEVPDGGERGCDRPRFTHVSRCAVIDADRRYVVAQLDTASRVQPGTFSLLLVAEVGAQGTQKSSPGAILYRAVAWKGEGYDGRERTLTVERICELTGGGTPEIVVLDVGAAGMSRTLLTLRNGTVTASPLESAPGAAEIISGAK